MTLCALVVMHIMLCRDVVINYYVIVPYDSCMSVSLYYNGQFKLPHLF